MESLKEKYKSRKILIRKAIAAEEKTRGRLASQIKEVDQYCLRGHRPSLQANKYQQEMGQGQGHTKDPRQQEPKPSSSAPQTHQRNEAKRNEGKKFWRDKKLCHCQDQKEQIYLRQNSAASSTSATGANSSSNSKRKDLSHITSFTYFNCNKKGDFASNCSEPPKNQLKNQLQSRRSLRW